VRNLAAIEEHLRKLAPPSWPEPLLEAVDAVKAETGRAIFANTCAGCHAVQPIVGTDPVEWHVPVIPLDRIGTDPTLVLNFSGRRYDASKLGIAEKTDAVTGLTIVSEQIKARAYVRAGVTAAEAPAMDGFGREPTSSTDTCGYKARPLIGMWATPPFLHNGWVPTIADLLSETRPERFAIGGNDYDPARLGLSREAGEGALIYDTTLRGNGNGGHWFTDDTSRPGRIGRALSRDERAALIEYLKSATEATYPVRPVAPPLRRPTCPTNPDWAVKRLQAAAP
jgi:mono/diheme cytochrome c family protein